jgi:hypothetical protein
MPFITDPRAAGILGNDISFGILHLNVSAPVCEALITGPRFHSSLLALV